MDLYYDRRADGASNFGDDLNPWLWQRLLPEALAQADDIVLVGIGTLLNAQLPRRVKAAQRVLIFSTGVGYERPLQHWPPNWQVYCVRGPLSCQALALDSDLGITDGALLLRRVWPTTIASRERRSFMPHVHHAVFAGEQWQRICAASDLHYIDPRQPVEAVLQAIQQSQLLITEAMHGAIVADALGTPWIPVVTSPRILPFKWQDWCASVQLPYRPLYLPPLVSGYPRYGRGLRSGLLASQQWGKALTQRVWQPGGQDLGAELAIALERMARDHVPVLSDRDRLETLTQALEQKLDNLRQDLGLR